MKTKNACILLLAALTMTACEYDDSALWEQVNQNTERIAALEAWQAETNTNIQSLQTLLNTADYITAVTPVMEEGEEVGYTISFLHSDPITIYHGTKGDTGEDGYTPQIGLIQQDDGNWYWTLDGELMADADGNPIRANGQDGQDGDDGQDGRPGANGKDAPTPQVKIGSSIGSGTIATDNGKKDPAAWYLSVDNGQTWYRITGDQGKQGEQGEDGEKGEQGDSFFKDAPKLSDDGTYYTFTLADGTLINVLAYTGIKVDFGDASSLLMTFGETQPVNFTAEGSESFTTDNLFIIAPDGWKAEVTLPTTRAATEFILTVTAPADANSGATEGEILVMLDNGQGSTTIGRLKVAVTIIDINGTELTARNPEAGKLAEAIGNRADLTSVTVTGGTLNKADWDAIKQSNGKLQTIDLAGATYEGDDKDNWVYKIDYSTMDNILKTVKLPQGVTGLGKSAFQNCFALESIDLPDGVTSIGDDAFNYCTALESIDLPEGLTSIGNYAFNVCIALTSIDLPEGLTSIGNYAFNACEALESIDLPDKVTSIGHCAFSGCKGLTSIDLPETLTTIGNNAFQKCTSLATITLPDGVTTIESATFSNCTSLTTITLPDGVTTIESAAFQNCSALESIDLPEGLTSIGDYAFQKCTSLTTITLPDGVKSIGNATFLDCTALTSITLPKELTTIGEYAFQDCDVLTSITLPEGVTSIGSYAFSGCNALTSIDLPDGLESIGNNAFTGCNALTSIDLPDGLESIGDSAFASCSALESIDLPEGLTSIGVYTFYNCTSLTTITCLRTEPPTVDSLAFYGCDGLKTIYVPDGSEEAYKTAANWSAYENIIQAIQ